MGFLWRRRSSVVKIVILLTAVWFTIAFLIYSEDRRSSNVVASGAHSLELKYNNEFDDIEEAENRLDRISENVDRPFNNEPFYSKNFVNTENHKNGSVANNVIINNLNNNNEFNNIRNKKIDGNISGSKSKRLNAHQKTEKKAASDDTGGFIKSNQPLQMKWKV